MKAAIYTQYGKPDVVQIKEVPQPVTGASEVKVKVSTTSVTSGDARLRAANPFLIRFMYGLLKPKKPILGHEYAGIVEEVGNKVTQFKKGDYVFGSLGFQSGSHAEYVVVSESSYINKLSDSVQPKLAGTSVISFLTANYFLNQLDLNSTKSILIHGASGSVGCMAVQLAKLKGLSVTAVCSTTHVEKIKALGADEVIDYKKRNFETINQQFDAVFSTVGKTTFKACIPLLKPNGTFLASEAQTMDYLKANYLQKTSGKRFLAGVSKPTMKSFHELTQLLNQDKLKPTIASILNIDDIAKAHQIVDSGHKYGNVAIQF